MRGRKVYFIQTGETGPVKIGSSHDPESRLRSLQVANPDRLTLLGAIPGGYERERQLHSRFAHLLVHGEWFRPAVELADFIRSETLLSDSLVLCDSLRTGDQMEGRVLESWHEVPDRACKPLGSWSAGDWFSVASVYAGFGHRLGECAELVVSAMRSRRARLLREVFDA